MASGPSHIIRPVGETSIQTLTVAGGRYPFWRARVCLFSKEKNRKCCLLCRPTRNDGNWAAGHRGGLLCVYANTDGIQFRLIPDTDCTMNAESNNKK